jgi:hypothetical protein
MSNKYYPRKDILQIDPSEDPITLPNPYSDIYNNNSINTPFKMGPIYTIPKNVTVYRGEGKRFPNEKMAREYLKETRPDEAAGFGRWYTKDAEMALVYAGNKGKVSEVTIPQKDFDLGYNLKNRAIYKTKDQTSPDVILLPKKNLKDVRENPEIYKDVVGPIASMEFSKGGLVSKGNGKVMKHKLKYIKKY